MDDLAHSARNGCPSQLYRDHVEGVRARATRYAEETGRYAPQGRESLRQIVTHAADAHDLGKLEGENQTVLHKSDNREPLPTPHQDAGAAWLVREDALLSAFLVKYHHQGLCDLIDESTEDRPFCRDDDARARERTDRHLDELARRHARVSPLPKLSFPQPEAPGDMQVFLRMALSCLADADHTDTATHYGQHPKREDVPVLRARERLARLDRYMEELDLKAVGGQADSARNSLRREMYFACRDNANRGGFCTCDGPVGSGKTTAIMAHLLRQALARDARRIFVVLPYTSILSQSVEVYREALTLPGEDPERVVAELHFRADFQAVDTRCLTALWRAPVVVTTAVAFFETLASNRPATLRRLHELPGSMIFLDEAHAALPPRLLPTVWHWMNALAEEWGCYWVLASGSLARFWQLDAFARERPVVSDLVNEDLRGRLAVYERQRVAFRYADAPKGRKDLAAWVTSRPGPRLVIVNTVQSAAVLADDFRNAFGRVWVEHLSAALTAEDRERTIKRVLARLVDDADDEWTLVATSCVEAGVNFSFRTGFREAASLTSLLQTAGRVNRHGAHTDAEVWSFTLRDEPPLTAHPGLQASVRVLNRYLRDGAEIAPELCTRAMQAELNENDSGARKADELLRKELDGAFRTVAREFVVIDDDTALLVPREDLARRIRDGQADWRAVQRHGVSVPRSRAQRFHLEEIARDIFRWDRAYDGFLGYMAGVVGRGG